jgi:DNA replication initiation complex subunit (GINS family)
VAEDAKEHVSYEMLQDLLRAERRSNKMMPVPARFWPMVREFLTTIGEAFQQEQARDPFGRKVMLLTDQVKNARHAAESLWAVRERKLAMLALAATKERKRPEGITPDEAQLYQGFLETLDAARGRLFEGTLPAVASPSGAPAAAPTPPPPVPVQMAVVEPAAAIPSPPVQVPHDSKAQAGQEMVTIRALGDIPPFVGPDMQTYLLKSGDVATVPPSIANLLVRRNKATILQA